MKLFSKALLKIGTFAGMIGPGLFLLGYNIGTGSITTMAKAGAEHGMSLFWAVVLSCYFTFILMVAYGRVTLVSGQTALYNIKTHLRFGKALAVYIMIALIIGEILALMGIMGISVDLIQEVFRITTGDAMFNRGTITVVLAIGLMTLLWFGSYQRFEKFLISLVVIMLVCFIVSFVLIKPSIREIVTGLVPRIPSQPGSLGLVAAMAGTTCSAAVFVIRSIVLSEKGWTKDHLGRAKWDSFVSASSMLFLSGIIMAVSAGTLHVLGLKLTYTLELIQLFSPIGGKAAALILAFGVLGAAISTVFPIILIAPWLICDYFQQERNQRSVTFRVMGGVALLIGCLFLFIDSPPPAIMVFSQAAQALILPAVTLPILILMNKQSLMGIHTADRLQTAGVVSVLIFSLVTSYFAVSDMV